jgi:hypothetical protein
MQPRHLPPKLKRINAAKPPEPGAGRSRNNVRSLNKIVTIPEGSMGNTSAAHVIHAS